jgi:hypothetical protein
MPAIIYQRKLKEGKNAERKGMEEKRIAEEFSGIKFGDARQDKRFG